jgi:deoxyribonuclease-4
MLESPLAVYLENTAGGDNAVARRFDALARLWEAVAGVDTDVEIGFCFDTCHAHAAGHDMRTGASASRVLEAWDRVVGLDHLRVVHLNDSKAPAGSRLDRHAHIGEGTIAGPAPGAPAGTPAKPAGKRDYSGFGAVLNHPALRDVPMILETPKEDDEHGVPWDRVNLDRLRRLLDTPAEPRSDGPAGAKARNRRRTGARA